jgi:NAD(P)-dependent dehydrogenase (short-subunit alcohol dehydrogenase family)
MEGAMTGRLSGKVAAITGGASGIGRAAVLRFLEEGASVTVADLNQANGDETMALAKQAGHGDRIAFQKVNVTEEADVKALVDATARRFGRLDIIFNNAGVGGAFGPLDEVSVEDWDYTFDVLVRGVFLGMKHAIPVMKQQGGGSIINTASIAGLGGGAGSNAYSAAKAAVANLTKASASDLARFRIRVNAIAPGVIWTPLLGSTSNRDLEDRIARVQPWPDKGRPEDIAAAALYLASDDGVFVSGHILTVDGAMLAQGPNVWGRDETSPMLRRTGVNKGTTGEASVVRR